MNLSVLSRTSVLGAEVGGWRSRDELARDYPFSQWTAASSSKAGETSSQRPNQDRQGGYTLAGLMVIIMVMSIMMAVAVPSWTNYVQREKEAEAVFRGMQYAEAIRVFQTRHGRPPTNLEELIKVEPRSIRQLYPNPLNESGAWGLLIQQGPPQAQGNNQDRPKGPAPPTPIGAPTGKPLAAPKSPPKGTAPTRPQAIVAVPPPKEGDGNLSGGRLTLGKQKQQTAGPIVGVYPAAEGTPLRTFNGATSYDQWKFQVDLIPLPAMVNGDSPAPRVTSEWIGKPFRSDIEVRDPTSRAGGLQNRGGRDLATPDNRGGRRGAFNNDRNRQERGSRGNRANRVNNGRRGSGG